MEITSRTRLYCLIGHPVEHSVSPQMHNSAFRHLGLDSVYLSFDVEPEELSRTISGLRALKVEGFNVTIPHKVSVMEHLDGLDESSIEVGAVNTVARRDGRLVGYNTDVYGVKKSLEDYGVRCGGRALILGAGGAARAAVCALRALGFGEVIIANRTMSRAVELVRRFRDKNFSLRAVKMSEAKEYSGESDLIINATPIGMWPKVDETPLTSEHIPRGAVVFDMIYNPLKTRLLEEAEKAGAKTISGLKLLVEQAARAFQLWTGLDPPRDVMWNAAEKAIKAGFRHEG